MLLKHLSYTMDTSPTPSLYVQELSQAARLLKLDAEDVIDFSIVRKSFCRIIKSVHPDKTSQDTFDDFHSIVCAYKVLKKFFDERGDQPNVQSFAQDVHMRDMCFLEGEKNYYIACRCSQLVKVPSIALSLGIKTFSCDGCSSTYSILK